MIRLDRRLLIGLSLLVALTAARAQTYPDRPIRMIVPFAAGTSTDTIGRALAASLSKSVGTMIVDDRPGALGTIGASEAARAKPDGYTVLLGGTTSMTAGPQMLKTPPRYDPQKDFIPIGRIAGVVFVLVVRSDLGVNNLQDLLTLAHKRKLNWGYANSANLAAGQMLVNEAHLDATQVPYKGVPQMMSDMLGGQIDFAVVDTGNAMPHLHAGKLRALAVTTPGEFAGLPGIPPLNTVVKNFQLLVWTGLFVPKGTPDIAIAALSAGLKKAADDPALRTTLAGVGNLLMYGDDAVMRTYMAEDMARWTSLIKSANIQPE